MLKAVLFDLDGTLLDIQLEGFLGEYFSAIAPVLSDITGLRTTDALEALKSATGVMCAEHGFESNRDAFNHHFQTITGVRLSDPEPADAVATFYEDVFPTLGERWAAHDGAREVVDAAQSAGMIVAVATNPIFPLAATVARLSWAGFSPAEFAMITTYENSASTKPHAAYFEGIAHSLSVRCDECLMIGDDEQLDLAAKRVGMITFHASDQPSDLADNGGSLNDAIRFISKITA